MKSEFKSGPQAQGRVGGGKMVPGCDGSVLFVSAHLNGEIVPIVYFCSNDLRE